MSGLIARRGFRYQDLYLLLSVLDALREEFTADWNETGERYNSPTFGVEGTSRVEAGLEFEDQLLDWDVLVKRGEQFELIEVKSGAVDRLDREHLWLRLRRELSLSPQGEIVPGLVVDPDKLNNMEVWRGFLQAVRMFSGPMPVIRPARVTTSKQLADEALWLLCSSDPSIDLSPCSLEVAIASLLRFQLRERRREELDQALTGYVSTLFSDGIPETIQRQLMGWIADRAQAEIPEFHFFTAQELMREIKMLERSISVEKGAIKRWRNIWDSLPTLVSSRSVPRIGNTGVSLHKEESQPAAVGQLTNDQRNIVIRSAAGVGKSALLAQLVAEQRAADRLVLWCGAADIILAFSASDFGDSVRFQADLETLRNPDSKCWLYVDGLDEVDASSRDQLARELQGLGASSNVRVTVSVRDNIWQGSNLRHSLPEWKNVLLQQWPEQTVVKLFEGTSAAPEIRGNLLTLLRTPILLDLFWRTFLEGETPIDRSFISRIQTRHGILAAFWTVRLLNSPRADRISTGECIDALSAVSLSCANQVGAFRVSNADPSALAFLMSESVLIEEGSLQRRFRFRHPLFRDFALAQWCLAGGTETLIAARCRSIQGSIQKVGCLRSIIEAFVDPAAATELPGLVLSAFLYDVASVGEEWGRAIARCLGMLSANGILDPWSWQLHLRSILPSSFGTDLFVSAQSNSNPSWGIAVADWPDNAPWYGNDFSERLLFYGDVMQRLALKGERNSTFRVVAVAVAKKLRHLSEGSEHAPRFARNTARLKAQAIRFVAKVEVSLDTLAWLERGIAAGTWRTRSATLEVLPYLAHVDPSRAGAIYRQVLGLQRINGAAVANIEWFQQSDYAALDLSLTSTEGPSLLTAYPLTFVEIALLLAEALWAAEKEDNRETHEAIKRLLASESQESSAGEDELSITDTGIGDLINDSPNLTYWKNSFRSANPSEKVLVALAHSLEEYYENNRNRLLSAVLPLFRASRLATVHSFVFDFCLKHACDSGVTPILELEVCDARLYHVLDLWHWIERSIDLLWPISSEEVRRVIVTNIDRPEFGEYRAQLLCRIPATVLTRSQLDIVEDYQRQGYGAPLLHPEAEAGLLKDYEGKWTDIDPESDWDRWMGVWPDSLDLNNLKEFHRTTADLERNDLDDDTIAGSLPDAIAYAANIVDALLSDTTLITAPKHQWVLARLNAILERTASMNSRREQPVATFPQAFVHRCAAIAWVGLSVGVSDIKMEPAIGDVISRPGHLWDTSVSLLDSAMMQLPLRNDSEEQDRFQVWLAQTMRLDAYIPQQIIAVEISPFHWFRTPERRALFEQLFWVETRHGAPIKWALRMLRIYSVEDQERILRLLLNRDDIEEGASLAKGIGERMGRWGLSSRNGGRLPVAILAREVIEQPHKFRLLHSEGVRARFLTSFMFGMKETAKSFVKHSELVPDYGDWSLRIWCQLRQQISTEDSRGIILFALYWLGHGNERFSADQRTLKGWCSGLIPLLGEIVQTGASGDVSALFQQLHNGLYADVLELRDLFDLVDRFCGRSAEQVFESDESKEKWLEAANYAAESLQALQDKALLPELTLRNKAYDLLTKLANTPIGSSQAGAILARLQAADE